MKYRRTSTRPDRTTAPHSRIPDAIYTDVLPFLTGFEVKLWMALKSREWRRDGTRRGVVKKSLNQIAKDVRMSRNGTQRAFAGLRKKGLAEWAGFGIRLLEPDFTTAITTGFTTPGVAPLGPGVALKGAEGGPPVGRVRHLIPFPSTCLGVGDPLLRSGPRGQSPARTVDVPNVPAYHVSRRSARASARSSRALPDNSHSHSSGKDKAGMRDENDSSEKLDARPLDREAMRALLRKVRERAAAAADEGAAKREASIAADRQKDTNRLAELRRQADELLAAEEKPAP